MSNTQAASMAQVIDYPRTDLGKRNTAWVGMIIFITSWTMLFASLFFIYFALRGSAKAWPPAGLPLLPWGLPTLNTAVVLASSAMLELAIRSVRRGKLDAMQGWLLGAVAMGLAFLGLQLKIAQQLQAAGLDLGDGAYAAVYYGFAVIHAAHLVVGLLGLGRLVYRGRRGDFSPVRHLTVRMWAVYWHFVAIIWFLIYTLVIVA